MVVQTGDHRAESGVDHLLARQRPQAQGNLLDLLTHPDVDDLAVEQARPLNQLGAPYIWATSS